MNKAVVTPWMRVRDISLIILCWLTISPLMALPNKDYVYLGRKKLIWLIVFSPFVWTVLCGLLLIFGMPAILEHFPSLGGSILSFAKPEIDSVVSSSAIFWQSLLAAYFAPVYMVCVGVLFLAMALTGWTYVEASVYICQLAEPIVCCLVALGLIFLMLKKTMSCKNIGQCLMVIPIFGEMLLGGWSFFRFLENYTEFKTWDISTYFHHEVVELLELARETSTNYVVANMIVYIFPLLGILFVGYIAWAIWTLTRH